MRYLVLLLFLAGCQTAPVIMQNPQGQTVQCGPYPEGGMQGINTAAREAQCVQDYKEQGYVRISG